MIHLTYAVHDGVDLLADLYLPESGGPRPMVIGIPGGGWRLGSRANMADWGRYLAANGYASLAIDHRRTASGKMFPEAVQDVVAAMRCVHQNASAWGIDLGQLVMMGSSAGAHLAALASLAAAKFDPRPDAGPLPKVAAMVLAYGVYDLVAQWQHGLSLNQEPGEDRQARFLGATPYDDPDLYHLASPIRHVTYANNAIKALLIWGDEDEVVPCTQSLAFRAALEQARFRLRTCVLPGAGHFWFTDEPIGEIGSHTHYVAPRVLRFLNDALAKPKA